MRSRWGRLYGSLHSSVKWRRSTKGARALWASAFSWSVAQGTDGYIPKDMLRPLDGTRAEAARLVEVGLWEVAEDGWRFHDWLGHNPSDQQIQDGLVKTRERVAKHRERKRNALQGDDVTRYSETGNARSNAVREEKRREELSREVTVTNGGTDEEPPRLETTIPLHVIKSSWTPESRHYAYCAENGLDLKREAERFRADARSKRKARVDWSAEFDVWLSRSAEYAERDAKADARPGSSVWDRDVTGQGVRS